MSKTAEAVRISSCNRQDGNPKVGCVIMASGLAKRFGRDKLLADFQGQTLIERALDITAGEWFAKRVVVTRSEGVKRICEQRNVDVIFHDFPGRNDTVRLGIEYMSDMDACLFCPCDQPLLQKESMKKMVHRFTVEKNGIFRLSWGEKQGTPVLFGKEYFHQLSNLPFKCGGSYVVKAHLDQVKLVYAQNELELFDIDTPQDYEWLLQNCGIEK